MKKVITANFVIILFVFVFFVLVYFDDYYVAENSYLLRLKLEICDLTSDMKKCSIYCRSGFCTNQINNFIMKKGDNFIKEKYVGKYKCFDKVEVEKLFDKESVPYYFLNSRKNAEKVCLSWDFRLHKSTGILFLEDHEGSVIEIREWNTLL